MGADEEYDNTVVCLWIATATAANMRKVLQGRERHGIVRQGVTQQQNMAVSVGPATAIGVVVAVLVVTAILFAVLKGAGIV